MDPYRLPSHVVPTRYDLRLEPDLASATFTGEETIALRVREPTAEIVLNAIELEVLSAALESEGDTQQPTIALEPATERCRLTFSTPLAAGVYRLRLGFRGILNNLLRGFYRSQYRDATGATKTLAATQFEATDARRAFPCWDEPAFKAVFATTLVIDPALTAVSNTAVAGEERRDGKKVVRFADTIPMSSYLVAFIVGELEARPPVQIGRAPLRVWSVPGKAALGAFGEEIGAASLRLFEEYYGRPYPGDKLDLLAIPDFAAGAMENLGAITFRETALLVDAATATHAELERVADVVAHENAHMWFGDLVTMSWWNGLWLNEAFATFMQILAVDAWKPHWRRWDTFGVMRAQALVVDGLHSTRPIEYPVAAPKDADAMFDVLTYQKGASVLRMLEQHLGPDVFRAGVRHYLDKHAYGCTETEDLWRALGQASGAPIPQVMDGWVFRPGYPMLSVKRDGDELVLQQQRFTYLQDPPGPRPAPRGEQPPWQIPVVLRITAGGQPETRRLLLTAAETRLDAPPNFESVLVNAGGHGFYRVQYTADLLEPLLQPAALVQLGAVERFNLVNDAWAAVLAGLMPAAEFLDLTARFRGERDKNVWAVLIASFQALERIVEDPDRLTLAALVRDRLGPAVLALGWRPASGEDSLTSQLRGELLRTLGTLGHDAATQQQAARLLPTLAEQDANVQAAVIAITAVTGDTARFDDFFTRFRQAKTPQDEQRYLHALGSFRPETLQRRTLGYCLDGVVRGQDVPLLIRGMLWNVTSRAATWDFVRDNWAQLSRDLPPVGLRRMMEGVTGLATPSWENEVREFFVREKIDFGGRVCEQYLEQLRIAVALQQRLGRLATVMKKGQART